MYYALQSCIFAWFSYKFCALSNNVTPYNSEGEDKKEQVGAMFDNIAPYYDFLNHFLSLGIDRIWRKKAIKAIKHPDLRVLLDIATGTGDFAIEAVKQMPDLKVIGIDISNEMLEIGNRKMLKKGLENSIELHYGDSENIDYEDNSFDALTVAFGVRNFANTEKGLREMLRVLKPGAKACILEFTKPRTFPFKQLYNFYFKYVLPLIGRITSKDKRAYAYLYESVQAFPDNRNFIQLLEECGYRRTTFKSLSLGICAVYIGEK